MNTSSWDTVCDCISFLGAYRFRHDLLRVARQRHGVIWFSRMERIQLCVHPFLAHILMTVTQFYGGVLPACGLTIAILLLSCLALRVNELLDFGLDMLVFLGRAGSWCSDRPLLQDWLTVAQHRGSALSVIVCHEAVVQAFGVHVDWACIVKDYSGLRREDLTVELLVQLKLLSSLKDVLWARLLGLICVLSNVAFSRNRLE